MKVRTIKKLIAQYPPIIEIRVKEETLIAVLHQELIHDLKNALPKYLKNSLIFIVPIDIPNGVLTLKEGMSNASIEEFKEVWRNSLYGLVAVGDSSKIQWIEMKEPMYVTIHSAITSTPFMYKKTLERLNNKIKEINM
jgi:hypothetical protein